jgi:hypothetical protein
MVFFDKNIIDLKLKIMLLSLILLSCTNNQEVDFGNTVDFGTEPRKNYLIGYIVCYVGGIYMNTDIIS